MNSVLPLIQRAASFGDDVAILDEEGTHTYEQLLDDSRSGAGDLLAGKADLEGERVALMVPAGYTYVRAQWSIWSAGGVVVPICLTHPGPEIEHVLDTTTPTRAIVSTEFADVLGPLAEARNIDLILDTELGGQQVTWPDVDPHRPAMILFTSGTTGLPKGVVSTHSNIRSQIESLVSAWEWTSSDSILLTLPLHHIHGIVNVLGCALWSGARVTMAGAFSATTVSENLGSGDFSLYMAVPTIYHKLIAWWDAASEAERGRFKDGMAKMRLMVSGSAALPVPVLERWREISGQVLLERYGMTEIGMALSNPYRGDRVPGSVGRPLPSVELRLVDETGAEVPEGQPGEIQVRGPNVFKEYWERPDATSEAFAEGGWFKTGDTAIRQDGIYSILGRNSVDILKTGGEKVSALEIESVLLEHEAVDEVAVVGIDDVEWGQRVVAAVVSRPGADQETLRSWCRERLAPYKVPKEVRFVDALPRNAMGKVVKPSVADLWTRV